jgi:hypothetical protein
MEMRGVRSRKERGGTMVVVEKAEGRCEVCWRKERRRVWVERGRYWRGLVYAGDEVV